MAKTVQQRIDEAVEAELNKYKQKVRDVAHKVAEENNWCKSGVAETLSELDISSNVIVSGRMRIEFDFEVEQSGGYLTTAKQIEDSINKLGYYAHDINLYGDDDLVIVPNSSHPLDIQILSVETEDV